MRDAQYLKLAVYTCRHSPPAPCNFAVRTQRCVCVYVRQRVTSHPIHCVYEKKCFTLSLLHTHILAYTDSLFLFPYKGAAPTIPDSQGCAGVRPPRLCVDTQQHLEASRIQPARHPETKTQTTKAPAQSGSAFCLPLAEEEKTFLSLWVAITLHLCHLSALNPNDHHHQLLPDYRISHRSFAIC